MIWVYENLNLAIDLKDFFSDFSEFFSEILIFRTFWKFFQISRFLEKFSGFLGLFQISSFFSDFSHFWDFFLDIEIFRIFRDFFSNFQDYFPGFLGLFSDFVSREYEDFFEFANPLLNTKYCLRFEWIFNLIDCTRRRRTAQRRRTATSNAAAADETVPANANQNHDSHIYERPVSIFERSRLYLANTLRRSPRANGAVVRYAAQSEIGDSFHIYERPVSIFERGRFYLVNTMRKSPKPAVDPSLDFETSVSILPRRTETADVYYANVGHEPAGLTTSGSTGADLHRLYDNVGGQAKKKRPHYVNIFDSRSQEEGRQEEEKEDDEKKGTKTAKNLQPIYQNIKLEG